jgi:hypothetical protein
VQCDRSAAYGSLPLASTRASGPRAPGRLVVEVVNCSWPSPGGSLCFSPSSQLLVDQSRMELRARAGIELTTLFRAQTFLS